MPLKQRVAKPYFLLRDTAGPIAPPLRPISAAATRHAAPSLICSPRAFQMANRMEEYLVSVPGEGRLQCRMWHNSGSACPARPLWLSPRAAQLGNPRAPCHPAGFGDSKIGVVVLHPWATLGGSMDDPLVLGIYK
jgi:hypothetical protein